MSALQGSVGDDPRPVSRLSTVGDHLGLDVTDLGLVVTGRTKDAEVVDLWRGRRCGGVVRGGCGR